MLAPLIPDDGIPRSWIQRFGPLEIRAHHAGVCVLRLRQPREGLAWLKLHHEQEVGDKEAALLVASLPLDRPELLMREDVEGGAVLLGLSDVRLGRDQALGRIEPESLPAMAALLGRLSNCAPAGPPPGRRFRARLAQSLESLAPDSELRTALTRLLPLADGLCHGDLHASNWLTEQGRPVGLLDWSAAHFGDPEWDLARLLAEACLPVSAFQEVEAAWEDAAGRELDGRRLLLYCALEGELRGLSREALGPVRERLRAAPLAVGDRAKPKPDKNTNPCEVPGASGEGVSGEVAAKWVEQDPGEEGLPELLAALGRPTALGLAAPEELQRFGRHACNRVLRLAWPGQAPLVLKAFRKPVPWWLFEVEARLAEAAKGSALSLPAPRVLGSGGLLFRAVGCPVACYPLEEGRPLESSPEDAVRLAHGQVDFHRLLAKLPLELLQHLPLSPLRLEPETCPAVGDLDLGAEAVEAFTQAWQGLADSFHGRGAAQLPEGLLHGSLHRDHTAWSPSGRLVVYDLEKLSRGPRLLDLVQSATYLAYRNRDERPCPELWIHYLRAYHQRQPLSAAELQWAPSLLMRCLFLDLKNMRQEGFPPAILRRHLWTLLNFQHNLPELHRAMERHLA